MRTYAVLVGFYGAAFIAAFNAWIRGESLDLRKALSVADVDKYAHRTLARSRTRIRALTLTHTQCSAPSVFRASCAFGAPLRSWHCGGVRQVRSRMGPGQ